MKFIDLTIPLGVATPPWPTYEPLQLKYFKRLAPNGANGHTITCEGLRPPERLAVANTCPSREAMSGRIRKRW